MEISKENLFSAASQANIPKEQIEKLWKGLETLNPPSESNAFTQFLSYFGALIVIAAMTWLMTFGWEQFGGGGIFLIAAIYALFFSGLGSYVWDKKGLKTTGGLLITMAVSMVPLMIYGLETYFNLWPSGSTGTYQDFYYLIGGRWLWIEIGTILAALFALQFFPFPFLTAPIFIAGWFLSIDIVPVLFGDEASWDTKCWISICFGLAFILIGYFLDRTNRRDYAFWSYLFGTLSFWIGLNCLVWDRGEFALFLYLIISLILMCLAVFLRRNVLMVFGALGVFTYLGHLAYDLFKDSILFPFILSFIGLLMIYLGFLYQKRVWPRLKKKG